MICYLKIHNLLKNGIIVEMDISMDLGVSTGVISKVLKGKQKTIKGYRLKCFENWTADIYLIGYWKDLFCKTNVSCLITLLYYDVNSWSINYIVVLWYTNVIKMLFKS